MGRSERMVFMISLKKTLSKRVNNHVPNRNAGKKVVTPDMGYFTPDCGHFTWVS